MLTVRRPPRVNDLYFWALQVSFFEDDRMVGAAHLGLQWNRRHPGGRAVNWGGYAKNGSILRGDESSLPSAPDDRNTRDLLWSEGVGYWLRVVADERPGWWRGEVQALPAGEVVAVRALDGGGDSLGSPIVWSEVFAPCEAPSVAASWRDHTLVDAGGRVTHPAAVRVNYQSTEAGGCDNTNTYRRAGTVFQVTSKRRRTSQGARLLL